MNSEDLRTIYALRDSDPEALKRLAVALQEHAYADGQLVFAEGDPGDSMYFILEGRVRIEKRAQATHAVTKTLTVLETGDYFGEMALFDQKPRSASAVAAGPARILRLPKAGFDEVQRQNPDAGMNVLFAFIRTSSDRIRRLSTQLVVYDQVGKAIGESKDLQSLLDVILQQLFAATLADWGLLLLRSQFSEKLEIRAEANLSLSPSQRAAIANAEGFLGPIVERAQSELVGDFDRAETFQCCPRLGFETPSFVAAPITVGHELLGIIILGGMELSQFNQDALHLSRGVASQAAQAILNARYREEEQARSRHSQRFVKF
jgi:CRP-like cAMP-binding protein